MPDRVLIVANAFAPDARASLPASLLRDGPARELLVIAPMLTTRSQSFCSDIDGARRSAEARLDRIAADMGAFRPPPRVAVADEDQLHAVADALVTFDAEACVFVTHTPELASYHERGVPERIRDHFGLPTTTLTVDGSGRVVGNR
jgi:hypothetical protein